MPDLSFVHFAHKMPREGASANELMSSVAQKTRLTALPYDILYKILSLVLPTLPPRVALLFDRPRPAWLDLFIARHAIISCPSVVLVCRLLTRHCLRILYTHTQLSIHAGRSHLARLSRLRARRYIRKLDIALERQLRPNSKQKHEVLLRHETSCSDIVSFYSPAYLVDLLHRIFPRLKSISLTLERLVGLNIVLMGSQSTALPNASLRTVRLFTILLLLHSHGLQTSTRPCGTI